MKTTKGVTRYAATFDPCFYCLTHL